MQKPPPLSVRPPLCPSGSRYQSARLSVSLYLPQPELSNNMTQTDFLDSQAADKPPDSSLYSLTLHKRLRSIRPVTHRKTSSLPEELPASLVLTPSISTNRSGFRQTGSRFEPAISRLNCTVRGSGFRQQLSKVQLTPRSHKVSLRRKMYTMVKGRRLVLSSSRSNHIAMCEATTLTESP